MQYIDSHAHLGDCRITDLNVTETQLLETLENAKVDAAIVQPYPFSSGEDIVHDRIYDMCKKHPRKIYGLVSINPHIDKVQYEKRVRHYIEDCGFLGVKLNTVGHAVHPHSNDARTVYELASKLGIPVNIHTGIGVPYSLPSLCLEAAQNYPEVKFVLAHSGSTIFSEEALAIAKQCANIYLETSWCSLEDSEAMVRQLGSDRVMMGSDSIKNLPYEVCKYKLMDLTQQQRENVCFKTASAVFAINKDRKR